MRKLRRPQYLVPTMTDGGSGGKRRIEDRREFEQNQTVPVSFPPYWTRPDVRGLLHAMQGRVCAYCGRTSELDTDHFRPKGADDSDAGHGGYWWLAYEISNYLLGCTGCNQKRKRAHFPLIGGAVRCTYATRDRVADERRVLPDPAEDPVEEWLTMAREGLTARLLPNPDLDPAERTRVQDAIDLLGLNLDPGVRSQRSDAYEEAARAMAQGRWEEVRQRAMRHRPHSLAARIVLQRAAPDLLPSAQEEMRDLIDSLWMELVALTGEVADLRAKGRKTGGVDERQLEALAWAIVILRNDPPAGSADAAEAQLAELIESESAATRAQILALFRRLPSST